MSNRLLRVNELMQREISAYLHSRYSSEAVAITISGVQVTGDLREGKVYFSVVGGPDDFDRAERWLRGKLGEIRSMVAKNVVLRHVPLLTVHPDHSAARALRVDRLLDEIDGKGSSPS
ncbi:MAG TPA: ribosome-binding factor A [Candidatus Didemnitutus sp.]|jgi:ribosome-binding factor A